MRLLSFKLNMAFLRAKVAIKNYMRKTDYFGGIRINKESRELIRETLYNNKEASILFLQMECLHEDFVVHT